MAATRFGHLVFVTIFAGWKQCCYSGHPFPSIGVVLLLLGMLNLSYGLEVALLRFGQGRENTVSEMFKAGFAENYGRVLGVTLLTMLFVVLWSLLLLIPGIVKGYSYALTFYIANDHPELSPNECINRSIDMMQGHKVDLFLLHLSFIGWIFLGLLSLGIGLLWVAPWMRMAQVGFYQQLKAEWEGSSSPAC